MGIGFVELTALVALLGPVGLPVGLPPAAEDAFLVQAAPDDGLYYSMWVGSREATRESSNRVERFLAEPELRQFVQATVAEIERVALASAKEGGSERDLQQATLAISMAKRFMAGPTMSFVNKVVGEGGVPAIDAGIIVKLSDGDDALVEQLQQVLPEILQVDTASEEIQGHAFQVMRFPLPYPRVHIGRIRDYLVIGLGEGAVEGILSRAKTPAPDWYQQAKKDANVQQLAAIGYLDLAQLRQLVPLGSPPPGVFELLERVGVDNLDKLTTVSGLDDEGLLKRVRLSASGPLHGLVGLVGSRPLDSSDLSVIPADATAALALSLDPGELFDNLKEIISTWDPQAGAEFDSALKLIQTELGFDLREDLLGSLGSSWRIYTTPTHGNWLTGWTASISVKDPGKLREVHDNVLALLQQMFAQVRQPPQLRSTTFEGHQLHFLVTPSADIPMTPCWTITENELVVGLYPQSVKSHLSRGEGRPGLAGREELKTVLAEGNVASIQYLDLPKIAEYGYPLLQVGLRLLSKEVARQGVDIPVHKLPTAETVTRHLQPYLGVLQRENDALVYRSRNTLPASGDVLTTAPFTVAALVPAVAAARNAARRVASMNNVKQQMIALLNFSSVYGAFPAMCSTNQDGKKLLSWRVHLLPFVEQDRLYMQFKMDEPWDSEHNRRLIPLMPALYRSPFSALPPGKSNYVTVRLPGEDGETLGMFGLPRTGPAEMKRAIKVGDVEVYFLGIRQRDVLDGTAQTLAIVEVSDEIAVPWTQPEDIVFDPEQGTRLWGAPGQSGITAGMADGSAVYLSRRLRIDILRRLLTRAGGEALGSEGLAP